MSTVQTRWAVLWKKQFNLPAFKFANPYMECRNLPFIRAVVNWMSCVCVGQKRVDLTHPGMIYFINSDETGYLRKSIRNGRVQLSSDIANLYQIRRKVKGSQEQPLALGTKPVDSGSSSAKLFQDTETGNYFAVVMYWSMRNATEIPQKKLQALFPDHTFSSVQETKLMFDINDFLKVRHFSQTFPQ